MDADAAAALGELSRLRDWVAGLTDGYSFSEEHTRWIFAVKDALNRYFGARSDFSVGFANLNWSIPSGTLVRGAGVEEIEQAKVALRKQAYQQQLNTARGLLSAAIDRVERTGLATEPPAAAAPANRRIFISHGGEPPALAKVEEIVRALGFEPVIVAKQASRGLSVDQLVPERMRECCCAIVLATRDAESPNSTMPRGNVIHETGLAQEIFHDKVIYLLEQGVEFPSNIRPKVWQSFGADNLEPLWGKIVKELRAFELIQ